MQEKHGDLIRVRMDFEQKRDDSFNPNETMIWKLEIRYGTVLDPTISLI